MLPRPVTMRLEGSSGPNLTEDGELEVAAPGLFAVGRFKEAKAQHPVPHGLEDRK